MSWQLICSSDRTILAEVEGEWEEGDTPPEESYTIIGGVLKKDGQIKCPHPNHGGNQPAVWKRKKTL